MDKQELTQLLQQVADGDVTPDDAALRLKMQPFQEIGAYAKVDFHRGIRQGVPEVIFGEGKAKEHILGIAREMLRSGQRTILITRLSAEAAVYLEAALPLNYDSPARVGIIGELPPPGGKGRIVVATGGTSDIPVAEEAALTAQALGNEACACMMSACRVFTGCSPSWTRSCLRASLSRSRAWRARCRPSSAAWPTVR